QIVQKPPIVAEAHSEEDEKADEKKSIAVLAFADMSPKQDQEYFADGISEEILNSLSKSPDLTVMSRTSSFHFEGKDATIEEISEKLDVNYILEGSVRKSGNQIRVTAQLINASTRAHLWSETYDRELKDIFEIQDEIAGKVSSKLQATLLGSETKKTDPEVYNMFLRARHLYYKSAKSSFAQAKEILEKAIEFDPSYAPAWSLLGRVHTSLAQSSLASQREKHIEKAGEAARRSIEIDPDHAMGYMVLANYMLLNNDFKKAKKYGEMALELSPNNPDILRKIDLATFPTPEETIGNIKKSLELDPLFYSAYSDLAYVYMMAGKYKKALEALKVYEARFPGAIGVSWLKSRIYMSLGMYNKGMEEIRTASDEFWKNYALIEGYYYTGRKDKALELLDQFINKYPKEATNIADIYARLNMKEKTFQWLQKAEEINDPTLGPYLYMDSFAKYHSDPRWQQLLEEMEVPRKNGIPGYKEEDE
ncbi:MAG TPA: tetratricopeptide repeat protein, partial [Salinimicrobium sp.]|nr:tetratricopeptide repeat protein [Salinimicrobium sp.]